jgi:hypothetical protein
MFCLNDQNINLKLKVNIFHLALWVPDTEENFLNQDSFDLSAIFPSSKVHTMITTQRNVTALPIASSVHLEK